MAPPITGRVTRSSLTKAQARPNNDNDFFTNSSRRASDTQSHSTIDSDSPLEEINNHHEGSSPSQKKRGRKPSGARKGYAEVRKQQNRAAQYRYRERRIKYVSDLEEEVVDMEAKMEAMRAEVIKLRHMDRILRSLSLFHSAIPNPPSQSLRPPSPSDRRLFASKHLAQVSPPHFDASASSSMTSGIQDNRYTGQRGSFGSSGSSFSLPDITAMIRNQLSNQSRDAAAVATIPPQAATSSVHSRSSNSTGSPGFGGWSSLSPITPPQASPVSTFSDSTRSNISTSNKPQDENMDFTHMNL